MEGGLADDADFSQRLRDLDQAAWAALFDEHHDKIWRYAYAKTGDRDVAEDVASQVFVEALESIDRFRYRGKPILAWLFRIARNQLGKRFRSAKHESAAAVPETSTNPIDAALNSLILSDALATLTRDQADVVALRFYAGYSTREIASAIGKSESAVYSLEVRAIAALRRNLKDRPEIS